MLMTIWKCPCPAFSLMYKHTYLHMHCTYRRYFSPIIEIISRWPRKARITTVKVTQRSNGTLWLYFAPNKSHYVIICHPLPATPPKNNNQKKAAGWGGDGEDELRWGVCACACVCLPACGVVRRWKTIRRRGSNYNKRQRQLTIGERHANQ